MVSEINIADYSYELPDDRIAKYPVEPRDSSKLLYYKSGDISHHNFTELSNLLPDNAHLVFNNTKVIPARLLFKRETGALIEVFLLNPVLPSTIMWQAMTTNNHTTWHCIIGNKKKWKRDEKLTKSLLINDLEIDLEVSWIDTDDNIIAFKWNNEVNFSQIIEAFGQIPLPPYLNRASDTSDKENYQTVYSTKQGAVAAPTAGLHFSENVLEELNLKGVKKTFVTLHVGAGTFMPVKTENVLDHPMHNEQLYFTKDQIEYLYNNLDYVLPVGTTSMRSLESLYWFGVMLITDEENDSVFFIEKLYPYKNHLEISAKLALEAVLEYLKKINSEELSGNTEILIYPSYKFRICKGLITNFHQPNSTLILLVAALLGEHQWKTVYQEAMSNDYRFLSFGDSSLLIP